MLGFNSISLSSYQFSQEGKEAHLELLHPSDLVLIIEDMNLALIRENMKIDRILVTPLMIENVDGVPATVWAEVKEETEHK